MTRELIEQGSEEWAAARKRVVDRRDFGSHLVAYLVVNTFLVGIWLLSGGGYFWPAWIMGGWGVGLVMHAWELYGKREVTDADVEAELQRHQH